MKAERERGREITSELRPVNEKLLQSPNINLHKISFLIDLKHVPDGACRQFRLAVSKEG